jgi:type I restriction enzyme S subunit
MTFERVKVGAIANFHNSRRKPVTKQDRIHGTIPYYGAAGIQDFVADFIFDGHFVLVGEDGTVLQPGGKPTLQNIKGKSWVNNHAHVLSGDDSDDTDFLYYSLGNEDISAFVTGAVQMKLSMGNLKEVEIFWPSDKSVRSSIVQILRDLDHKIAVDTAIAENLEQIAHSIFTSWFINFEPVQAKIRGEQPGVIDSGTAEMFPNSFEDSELGPKPAGWTVNPLGARLIPKKGKVITKSQTRLGQIPVVAGGLEPAYFHDTANVQSPVVTISSSGANAGFVRLYTENIWASDCTYVSKDETESVYFWYSFLKLRQGEIWHMQQGGAQPHIYASDLMRIVAAFPNENGLMNKFESLVTPLFELVAAKSKECKTLASIRDSLLPRLVSGELVIPDGMDG